MNQDMSGESFINSIRKSLAGAKIGGDTGDIHNFVQAIGHAYKEQNPHSYISKEDYGTLAIASILLNVDQHSLANTKKHMPMKLSDFTKPYAKKNINEADFVELYESVCNDEIILPSEHSNIMGFLFRWNKFVIENSKSNSIFLVLFINKIFFNLI